MLDPVVALGILGGVLFASWFNYILNRAPGSDPDDFLIGPPALEIRCDCFINTMIVGGILVLAMAIMSPVFASRTEMYVVGIVSYIIITLAGVYGRKKRQEEWRELNGILKRSVPQSGNPTRRDRLDMLFRDYDEEDY
ncbi:MAG: hypothetical protein ACXACD_08075 [Candidatus Thorarchaeota archaeon]|jgi:hypothetical protein